MFNIRTTIFKNVGETSTLDTSFNIVSTYSEFISKYLNSTDIVLLHSSYVLDIYAIENITLDELYYEIHKLNPDVTIGIISNYYIPYTKTMPFHLIENLTTSEINRVVLELESRKNISKSKDIDITEFQNRFKSKQDIVTFALNNPSTLIHLMKKFIKEKSDIENKKLLDEQKTLELSSVVNSLKTKIKEVGLRSNRLTRDNAKLYKTYSRLVELLKNNQMEEEIAYTLNNLQLVPNMIYFKEYKPLMYISTLLQQLKYYLLEHKNMYVRLVYIYPAGARGTARLNHPTTTIANTATRTELEKDDIIILGKYNDLLHSVISNKREFDLIIVLDRTGDDEVRIRDNRITYICTSTNSSDLKRSIGHNFDSYTYDKLHPDFIDGFEEKSLTKKSQEYQKMQIFTDMLQKVGDLVGS